MPDDNPLEGQPFVKLRHPDLDDRETTQPLSYAKNLVTNSGWLPADDAAAQLLGLTPPAADAPAQAGVGHSIFGATSNDRTQPRQQEADAPTEKGD